MARRPRPSRVVAWGLATLMCVLPLAAAGRPVPARAEGDAQPTRVVLLKFDGLSPSDIDRFVDEPDPRTGRTILPWIKLLFYDDGVRFANFYTRGMSLSMTSWAILDTGRHGVIKGNWEVDRNTGEPIDYLNVFDFHYEALRSRRVYPRCVEMLDAADVPLLADAFQYEERRQGIQLLRRGTMFRDFLDVGLEPVKGPVRERVGEILAGIDFEEAYAAATREDLLEAAANPRVRYVDYYDPYADHLIHDDNDDRQILRALRDADRVIGEAYEAIARSGAAERTVLAVVSDHGITYDAEGRYSHGLNIVPYLTSRAFGAHNVLSRRGPLSQYTLQGSIFKPRPPLATLTRSPEPYPLAARPEQATCSIDNDGNERAQIHLRSPDLNRLQMLRRALRERKLDPARRAAAERAALEIVERNRERWAAEALEIGAELRALETLRKRAEEEAERLERVNKEVWQSPTATGPPLGPYEGASALNTSSPRTDSRQRERELRAEVWQYGQLIDDYGRYRASLELRTSIRTAKALLDADEEKLFGDRDFGPNVSAGELRAYPVDLREIALDETDRLDEARSFVTVDYLGALTGIRVTNTVYSEFVTKPVEFVATRLPARQTAAAAARAGAITEPAAADVTSALLVYGSEESQLVLLERRRPGAAPLLAAVPVTSLRVDPRTDDVALERGAWRAGLPLGLFEDTRLDAPGERGAWLSAFHTEREWLEATHRTALGLGVIGLSEVYSLEYVDGFERAIAAGVTPEERLARRLELRRRRAMETDLFLHAAPHWHFNVKDFNAGGNHGGFGRRSMHAVLWLKGGAATRVRPGPHVVERPYDALDFAPTLLELAGVTTAGELPTSLLRGGFRPFPGRIAADALSVIHRDEPDR